MDQLMKKYRQYQVILSKNPLYNKYSVFIIPAITIIIGLAILFFVTIPQFYKLIANNGQIENLNQQKSIYQDKIGTLNKVDVIEYKTDLNNVLSILPIEKDIPSAINSILQVISLSGMTLTNFAIGSNGTPVNGIENFAVNIEVTGTTDQLKNLINSTSRSPRLIKITSLSMNYGAGSAAQMSMDVLVFYAPLDTSVKSNNDQKIELLTSDEKNIIEQIQQIVGSSQSTSVNEPVIDGPTGKDDPFN